MIKRLHSIFSEPHGIVWFAPFALMAPAWLTGRAIFWGTPILQFVPWSAWAAQTLANGHLPLWNPLVGMGAPLLANYQSALFYPPNWMLLLLAVIGGPSLLAWGQALWIALHLAWSGVGMGRLAQRLGLSSLAGTVSGLAFSLCGYLVARAGFLSIVATAAWLPWILYALLQTMSLPHTGQNRATNQRAQFPALLIFSLAIQLLAGHAQTTWYTLLLAGLWAIFWGSQTCRRALADRIAPTERANSIRSLRETFKSIQALAKCLLQPFVILALAGLLAVGMAAVQLFPTAEYLLHSQRESGLDLDFALAYSFSPWHFLTLVVPDFFGNPGRSEFYGYANYWESAVYIGLLPLLLALRAASSALGRNRSNDQNRPTILFLSAVTLVSFALALGKNTTLYPWLYQHAPTFDMFLGPARWTLWAEFSLALLAGYGFQNWRRPQGRGLYWTRLGTAGAFAAIGGAMLAGRFSAQVNPTQAAAVAMAGVWAAGAGLLSLTAPRAEPQPTSCWRWGVTLLICADLLVAHFPLNPTSKLDLFHSPLPQSVEIRERLAGARLFLNREDEYALKFERFFRFDSYDPGEDWLNLRHVYLPNTTMLDDIPSANNFDPLVPARYARWMKYLEQAPPANPAQLLARMGVGLIERVDEAKPYGVSFQTVNHLGRLRWTPCAFPVQSPEQAWEKVTAPESTPDFARSYVVLEGIPNMQGSACNPHETGQVQIVAENPNALEIHVEASSQGWLVIADTWYPGWTARVDGLPTPVLKADYLFRAVAVPQGKHKIELRYAPIPFYVGSWISFLAWSGFGFAIFWRKRT